MNQVTKRASQRTVKPASKTTLAKIARPVLSGVYARVRLFRLLDKARKRPIVWLAAQAGSGKTTLVASYLQDRGVSALWYQVDAGDNDVASFFYYLGLAAKAAASRRRVSLPLLTPEYQPGLSVFTANYFRELFARLKSGSAIVLDNYQDVAADGKIQEIVQLGLEQIPAGITVIVISREAPPGAFARSRAGERIALLDWEALKLTAQESAGIVTLRRKRSTITNAAISRLHQDTQGWAAGLVLLTEGWEQAPNNHSHSPASTNQSIFDYFANEIFLRSGVQIQHFLLSTALLPKVSVRVANTLTADGAGESILRDLARRSYFTTQHTDDSYEYHPLFRAFLIAQVNSSYTAQKIRALKQECARALMSNGDEEQAIQFLLEAQVWDDALGLWLDCAPRLVEQGRTQTLEAWAELFPDTIRNHNAWMLYWLGICRLAFSPAAARTLLEPAFALFEQQDDATPLYLVWTAIVHSYVIEWSHMIPARQWLDRYYQLAVGRSPPDPEIEAASVFAYVAAMIYARFEDPNLPEYVERAERLFDRETNPDRQLMAAATSLIPCHIWAGNAVAARRLLNALAARGCLPDAKPLMQLPCYVYSAVHEASTGTPEESLRLATAGLKLAETTGVHFFDQQLIGFGVWGQICGGNVSAARTLMNRMLLELDRAQREAFYRQYASLVCFHEGDVVRAIEEARQGVDCARASGMHTSVVSCLLALAFALAQQRNTDAALNTISEANALNAACRLRPATFVYFCLFAEAHIRFLRGELDLCLRALREALAMCREMGEVVTVAFCGREDMARLYALALEHNIDPEHARSAIAKNRLTPPPGVLCEQWPWPVRIYALGTFSVMKNDAPLAFAGRAQRKPMELLRALIAFGGRDVALTKLAQALWPDTEADFAQTSLETTLHRLRKLLGEKCIVMQERRLTLNAEYCWVDSVALKQLAESDEAASCTAQRARRLIDLYRGPFLDGDDAPWVLIERERLRSKFLRALLVLGETIEVQGDRRMAVSWYEKGIDVDPLASELYLRLMRCHRQLQQPAEALSAYRRCVTTLRSALDIEPTAEMKSLHVDIQRSCQ